MKKAIAVPRCYNSNNNNNNNENNNNNNNNKEKIVASPIGRRGG